MEMSFLLLAVLYVMNSHYATLICFPINVFVKANMFFWNENWTIEQLLKSSKESFKEKLNM